MNGSGHELRENNEKIVKLMSQLKKQRDEMVFLIEKQEMEKGRIQNEIEKLSFKLTLLTKSLNQRLQARTNYDRTIHEIEENYSSLVEESGKLLFSINKEVNQLEQIMDKKIGTNSVQEEPSLKEVERRRSSEERRRSSVDNRRSSFEETDESTIDDEDVAKKLSEIKSWEVRKSKSEDPVDENKDTSPDNTDDPNPDLDVEPQTLNRSSSLLEPLLLKKVERVEDDEVQSFRDAYKGQHSHSTPHKKKGRRRSSEWSQN